jgi:hypothetical protein
VSFIAPADVEAAVFLSVVTLFAMVLVLVLIVGRRYRFIGHAVAAIRPSRQIFVTASFATERTPPLIYRPGAAHDAQRGVAHPTNHSWLTARGSRLRFYTGGFDA